MDVVLLFPDKRLQQDGMLFYHQLLNKSALTERAVCPFAFAVVCHSGAHAGAHVQAQDLQPQPTGLSQDMPIPKMAENGSPTRWVPNTKTHSFTEDLNSVFSMKTQNSTKWNMDECKENFSGFTTFISEQASKLIQFLSKNSIKSSLNKWQLKNHLHFLKCGGSCLKC